MTLIETLEQKRKALTAEELSDMLSVDIDHLYRMARTFRIPSMKVGNCVRFDPHEIAGWLRKQKPAQIGRPRRA